MLLFDDNHLAYVYVESTFINISISYIFFNYFICISVCYLLFLLYTFNLVSELRSSVT